MSDNLFRKEFTAAAGHASTPVILPRRSQSASVAVHPGSGGTVKVQLTLSSKDAVEQNADGASVRWIDWDEGLVSVSTARGLSDLVTAVRAVAVTADAVLEVIVGLDQ